uniref:Uncharacterized protein n=1 Tax=Hemiselmis tepida TaxID=464990 RepID=A0A7S0VZ76_9CRYP
MCRRHVKFLRAAVKWSQKGGVQGDEGLHLLLAMRHEAAGELALALPHYARSKADAARTVATSLASNSLGMTSDERELLALRAIFLSLNVGRIDLAEALHEHCCQTSQPNMLDPEGVRGNFSRLMLASCRRRATPLFLMLRSTYHAVHSSEPTLREAVERIGETYFGVAAPRVRSKRAGEGLDKGPPRVPPNRQSPRAHSSGIAPMEDHPDARGGL